MKFFYDNLIDRDGVIVNASSELKNLPAENVIHQMAKKRWKTKPILETEWVQFDLGLAGTADHVIIHEHNITNDDYNLKIQGSNSTDFTAPLFSETIGIWDPRTIVWPFSGGAENHRYWRFSFTKDAAAISSRHIGRIFLGLDFEASDGPDFDGYDYQKSDLARKQKSLGGQLYSERIDQYHNHKLDFTKCREFQVDQFRDIAAFVGETKSFFMQIHPTASGATEVWYVQFAKPLRARVAGFDTGFYWDVSLDLEEML